MVRPGYENSGFLGRIYSHILKPIFFTMNPDIAHSLGQTLLCREILMKSIGKHFAYEDKILKTDLSGMELNNPIGIGPALNKNGDTTLGLSHLGFGFVYIGSVRRRSHIGNMKPWMIRYEEEESLGNAMGLPSKGLEYVVRRLKKNRVTVPLICSVVGTNEKDILQVCSEIKKYVSIVEINSSCPTSSHEINFENDLDRLNNLLKNVRSITNKPILLKISPYDVDNSRERDKLIDIVETCMRNDVGIAASNTKKITERHLPVGSAGLSGKPLFNNTSKMIKEIALYTNISIPIIGLGGVYSGEDVFQLIENGANATALVTSFIYRGPAIVQNIGNKLSELLKERGFKSVSELRGYGMQNMRMDKER